MSANKRDLGSDLAKVDTQGVSEGDYAEIPELSDDWFERAVVHEGGRPLRRGRPRLPVVKQQVTLRLDQDVLERFRAGGPGWQGRINMALRKAAGVQEN